jgi:hypothetical protein
MTIFTYPTEKTSEGISEKIKENSKLQLESKICSYFYGRGSKEHFTKEVITGISQTTCYPQEKLKYSIEDANFYCSGYLDYLMFCWENDLGIEIAPCNVWNIILWKICGIVNQNSEKYRNIFTKNNEKKTISYVADEFDPIVFLGHLKEYIPTDTATWFPDFAHQPANYHTSMCGLFAEMVQKYYGCFILGCGCPKIRLIGDTTEWNKIITALEKIPVQCEYTNRAKNIVNEFIQNLENPEYWKKFFYGVRCGSGSQVEYKGYIIKLAEANDTVDKVPNTLGKYQFEYSLNHTFIPGLTQEHLGENGGVKVHFHSGIMSSKIDEHGIAVPIYQLNISQPDPEAGKLTPDKIEKSKKIVDILNIIDYFEKLGGKYDTAINTTENPNAAIMTYKLIGYIPFIYKELEHWFYRLPSVRCNRFRKAVVDFFEKLADYPENGHFDNGQNYYPIGKEVIRRRYRLLKIE